MHKLLTNVLVACVGSTFVNMAAAQGVYGPLELRGKEQNDLIDTANQYHAQFERRSLLHADEAVNELVRRVGSDLAPAPTDPPPPRPGALPTLKW